MDSERHSELQRIARRVRRDILDAVYEAGSGHIGGSFSCVELLTALYFEHMNVDPLNPRMAGRDRFIASKGHCAPALYAVLAERGYFPPGELRTLRRFGSRLQGHPDMNRTPGVDLSTGSLGMGLSAAIGLSLAARVRGERFHTYVLLGDGELQEGEVWESFMALRKFACADVTPIIDRNGVQLDGTVDAVMPLPDLAGALRSFGLAAAECDGHDFASIDAALRRARAGDAPTVVVARTVKGKGVSFMEGTHLWHGRQVTRAEYERARAEWGAAV